MGYEAWVIGEGRRGAPWGGDGPHHIALRYLIHNVDCSYCTVRDSMAGTTLSVHRDWITTEAYLELCREERADCEAATLERLAVPPPTYLDRIRSALKAFFS